MGLRPLQPPLISPSRQAAGSYAKDDKEKTEERFKVLPNLVSSRGPELVIPEMAVFSGDFVKKDEEGFLYFVGRKDEMIKTSGYRVSPNEVEEIVYTIGGVLECAAFGIDHPKLGQVIILAVVIKESSDVAIKNIKTACRTLMPNYMVPAEFQFQTTSLPRNSNGKIDRKQILSSYSK